MNVECKSVAEEIEKTKEQLEEKGESEKAEVRTQYTFSAFSLLVYSESSS